MSMSAALCYRPDRSAAELVFATQPGAYSTETLIDFLNQLHTLLGEDATIILPGARSNTTSRPSPVGSSSVPSTLPQRPSTGSQRPPHMTRRDHFGHPGQRPRLCRVSVRRRIPKQLLLCPRLLFSCQARRPTDPTGAGAPPPPAAHPWRMAWPPCDVDAATRQNHAPDARRDDGFDVERLAAHRFAGC